LQSYCQPCSSPLLARYDVNQLRSTLTPKTVKSRLPGLWRWAELLPVRDPTQRLTLGEGDTPILPVSHLATVLQMKQLYIKDESSNPTATFKARGLAVAVARAGELGVKNFVIPTAGNAGGALAAYAARAGKQAYVFMPKDAPLMNQYEVEATGAKLTLVDGLISDAAHAAKNEAANACTASGEHWFDVSTLREPYRLEGKKTMGFEIAEYFEWNLPEVIIYPTGGGTGLVGMWKAFDELEQLGWIGCKRPRMVCVQALGCAPIVKAFQKGLRRTETWVNAQTIASGLRVPTVFADRLILDLLQSSQGIAISVSDEEILAAQKYIVSMEGIFAAPEGAATFAALQRLLKMQWISPDACVLLLNTGSGLKYLM